MSIHKNIIRFNYYMDELKIVVNRLNDTVDEIKFLENVLSNTIKNKGDNIDILTQKVQSKINIKKSEKSKLVKDIKKLKKLKI